MSKRLFPASFLAVAICLAAPVWALTQVNVGEDQANQGMYSGGWNTGSGNDNGFFGWQFAARSDGEGSFAGHYLGTVAERSELAPIATDRVRKVVSLPLDGDGKFVRFKVTRPL